MDVFEARPASGDVHRLAEGPVWDADRERVLWVDIEAGHVFEGVLRADRVERTGRHDFDGRVAAVVPAQDGRLLVAQAKSLTVLGPGGTRDAVAELIPETKDSRLNDGACDGAGRFLVGSMALDDRAGDEVLCRLEPDGTVTTLDADLTLSNGLGWSPDGAQLYSVDSVPGVVWARGYPVDDGSVGARRQLLRVEDGSPDGLCVDVEGNLWVAVWGEGQVRCYSAGGVPLATVRVAAPHTSSVAFVGPDLDRLLITTATEDLSTEQREAFPDSGRLFLADVGTSGVPTTPWSGRGAVPR